MRLRSFHRKDFWHGHARAHEAPPHAALDARTDSHQVIAPKQSNLDRRVRDKHNKEGGVSQVFFFSRYAYSRYAYSII